MKTIAMMLAAGILFGSGAAEAASRVAMTCETNTGNFYFSLLATGSGNNETYSVHVREWNANAGSFRRDSIALVHEVTTNEVHAFRAARNRFGVFSVETDLEFADGRIFGAQGAIATCAAVPLEGDDSYE